MTTRRKLAIISIPIIVSIFALSLNGIYYNRYFLDSGYPIRLSLGMAVFFILSELFLWAYPIKEFRGYKFLRVSLIVFSILVTLSSQFSSTSQKESTAKRELYDAVDTSGEVDRYQTEIDLANEQIKRIGRMREEQLIIKNTEDDLEYWRAEKSKYEELLREARSENTEQVQKIIEVRTVYHWIAEDLPLILKQGITPDLIRVLFQAFSSLTLAIVAPISLTQVKRVLSEKKKKMTGDVIPEECHESHGFMDATGGAENWEDSPVVDPVPGVIATPPEPVAPAIEDIQSQDPFGELSDTGVGNILKMLTSDSYPDGGLMNPARAVESFKAVHRESPGVLEYTEEECQSVYDWIINSGLYGRSMDELREEALRVRQN